MTYKVKGSVLLGQIIASEKTEVLSRLDKSARHKDAIVVVRFIESGNIVAFVTRKHKDSFRNGEKSMTHARTSGEETWPVDGHLLRKAKRFKPHKVCIFLIDTEEMWLSDTEKWFDPRVRKVRRARVSGDEIFHLPSSEMLHVPRYEDLRKV